MNGLRKIGFAFANLLKQCLPLEQGKFDEKICEIYTLSITTFIVRTTTENLLNETPVNDSFLNSMFSDLQNYSKFLTLYENTNKTLSHEAFNISCESYNKKLYFPKVIEQGIEAISSLVTSRIIGVIEMKHEDPVSKLQELIRVKKTFFSTFSNITRKNETFDWAIRTGMKYLFDSAIDNVLSDVNHNSNKFDDVTKQEISKIKSKCLSPDGIITR